MLCCFFSYFFFLMIRRPPRSTRTDTLFPYTTLFRSQVAMAAGSDTVRWSARLKPAATLSLQAAARPDLIERWDVAVSPLLHATAQGVPLALDRFGSIDDGGYWHFLPLPGERLELAIHRPEAIKGNDQEIGRAHV